MKKTRLFSLVIICTVIMAGCGGNPADSGQPATEENTTQSVQQDEESVELTERQKEILTEIGLPTDYAELSDREKSAIVAIEDMLTYLENKYNEPFIYIGYVEGRDLEQEHLTAFPENGSMNDEVTVYRTYEDGEFTCTDNYVNILAAPVYQKAMEQYVSNYFTGAALFTEVTDVPGGEVPDEESALFTISAVSSLLLDASAVDEAQIDAFVQDYTTMMEENSAGVPSAMDIWLMDADTIKEINAYNYHDALLQAEHSGVLTVSVSSSGKVTVTKADAEQGG